MGNKSNKQPKEQEDTPFPEIRDPGAVREWMLMEPDVRQAAKMQALQYFKMGECLMEGHFQRELENAPQGTIPLFTLAEAVAGAGITAADLLPGATRYKTDSHRAFRAFLIAAADSSERGEIKLRDPVSLTPVSVSRDTWLEVMRSRPLDAEWDEREKLNSEHVWISYTENHDMVFRTLPAPWVVNIEEAREWMRKEGIQPPVWLPNSICQRTSKPEALQQASPYQDYGTTLPNQGERPEGASETRTEEPAQRATRIATRAAALGGTAKHGVIAQLAKEEGCSPSNIKRILKIDKRNALSPPGNLADQLKGCTSR